MPINGTGVMTTSPSQSVERLNSQPSALPPFGVNEIRKRTQAVQEIMRGVMREGTHYGTIPGTPKPSLWKAGAEVLCMTFRLAPILESRVTADDPDAEWSYTGTRRDGTVVSGTCIGFFEVESICTIHSATGEVLSRCSARCNNREAKYRSLSLYEIRNTILKMSEKRAFVSAVLMATGASDIFTQDLEEIPTSIEEQAPAIQLENSQKGGAASLVRAGHSENPGGQERPGRRVLQGLTTKREEWLVRAAREAKLPSDALDRCLVYLRSAEGQVLKTFFDELAKHRNVFQPFLTKAG